MVAALWDVLAKAANLAQMSGLHAVMLVAVAVNLLGIPQCKRECAKLERCSRRLHALLKWPTGCGAALLCSELGGPVVQALVDAAGLVDSYNRSTLWRRIRSGRSMANQLRDMQDVLDAYCGLLLFINASSDHTSDSSSVQALLVTNCSTVTTGTSDAQGMYKDVHSAVYKEAN
ncbi:hypothetical protein ZWY2020_023282 [Hordeum vulgare]|nr:hypothetical protein ZWY2020_023282 [Hordeum vulgare]